LKTIEIDATKCTGCHLCELACSFKHFKVFNPEYARIRVFTDDASAHKEHITCKQCNPAPCLEACPAGAISKDENNAIIVDHEKCIMCLQCVIACPYDAIKNIIFEDEESINVCNLCGGDPECVKYCYDHAIIFR